MNDFEVLKNMFDKAKIKYTVRYEPGIEKVHGLSDLPYFFSMSIDEGYGYPRFCASFYFERDNSLVGHACWE